jgi:hypothetical protein
MPAQPELTGFVFRTRGTDPEHAIRFITIAASQVEARETLSRYFLDPWKFELVAKGSHILRQAEGMGIVKGDGKTL